MPQHTQYNSALAQSLMVLSFVSVGLLLSVEAFSSQNSLSSSSPITTQGPSQDQSTSNPSSSLQHSGRLPSVSPEDLDQQLSSPSPSRQNRATIVAPLSSPRDLWNAITGLIARPSTAHQGTTQSQDMATGHLPQTTSPNTQKSSLSERFNPSKHTLTTTTSAMVVDLSDRQLTLYNNSIPINTYPIAVGKAGWETPLGTFRVTHKDPNPTWRHPLTGNIIPPGDTNPLGSRWIGFWSDGIHEIGFHGTNHVQSIGQAISHGCIRLHDIDIQTLYPQVSIGTLVVIQP